MVKTTCKDCPIKTQRYCRSKSIAKNSQLCVLAQEHRFNKGDGLLQDITKLFRNKESDRGESETKVNSRKEKDKKKKEKGETNDTVIY